MERLSCFKSSDIRGRVPEELNSELVYKIGRSFATVYNLKKVIIGRDIRLSSTRFAEALAAGLTETGAEVLDLGSCGTEEMYHAVFSLERCGVDGGVIVTASHNPKDYNGMKFVVRGARPVTGETGLAEMEQMILEDRIPKSIAKHGKIVCYNNKMHYIEHLLGCLSGAILSPLKIVVNSGNGCSGAIIDLIEKELPFEFVKLNHQPDGNFPKGVPNPLLPENREESSQAVLKHNADFGIAWDGDFDRCFFWDEQGNFIEGYYIVGLLSEEVLRQSPSAKILYDPRLIWNSEEKIKEAGGIPIITRTGHAFIKERMRQENAAYGGEMSAHHYFRDFGYCDSGMIPWLLVAALLSRKKMPLSALVAERIAKFPVSGEINSTVVAPEKVISEVEVRYKDGIKSNIDGLSVAYDTWRFNLRQSNTEPLLRLNVESRGDVTLLNKKTEELLRIIRK